MHCLSFELGIYELRETDVVFAASYLSGHCTLLAYN